MQTGQDREKTLRMVANGLAKRPAYLLLFGLGIIGGGISGGVLMFGEGYIQVFCTGAFFAFLLVAALAVIKVEEYFRSTVGLIPDIEARTEFLSGPTDVRMSGAWELVWKWTEVCGHDSVSLIISGASVFGVGFDHERNRTYWIFGRIDDDGDMPALFWGRGGSGPVGCAFLQRDGHTRFVGTWKGVDVNGNDSHCDLSLEKR